MAAITKTFHDHIRLSNIDGHGMKQILYPETTSDDIIMSDGNKLTNYLVNMSENIKFKKPTSNTNAKGVLFVDSINEEFVGICQNSANLWVGAKSSTDYHHNGSLFLSAGWSTVNQQFTPNESIKIAVPKDTDNDGKPDGSDTFYALHVGNYSKYAIPMSGSLNVTGDIGIVKPTTIENSKGIMFVDSNDEIFPGLIQNSSSLWIGARNSSSYHHKGYVFISSGWNNSGNQFTANPSIRVSVPRDNNNDGLPDGSDNYDVLHEGNYSNYAIPMSGSLNVTGNIGMNATSRGYLLHDGKQQYPGLYNNGNNLWIGATAKESYHHYGMSFISAGWHNYATKYINSNKTDQTAVMVLNRAYSPSSSSRTIRIYNYSTGKYENYVLPANRTAVNIDDVKVSLPGVSYGDWVKATSEMSGVEPNETIYISLPEFDVVEGYYYSGQFYTTSSHTTTITPDTTHIYLDLGSGKLYKWNGNSYVITTEIIPTTATNYPVLHSGNSGNYDINFDSFRGITFTNTYTTHGVDNEIKYFALRDSGTNLWIGAEKGDAFHHLGKTFISAGWNYDYLGSSTNRSIYVSVPRVSSGQYPYDQSGCDNYEVVHAGIFSDYLDNNIGNNGVSTYDSLITTYERLRNTSGVPLTSVDTLSSVPIAKNSGTNFWFGTSKAQSYHHYGQTLLSTGWRYIKQESEEADEADVNLSTVFEDRSGYGEIWYLSNQRDITTLSTGSEAYVKPYDTIKIAVPKYNPGSDYIGGSKYHNSGSTYWGTNTNPLVPNDCDNYNVLHTGNFQTWFYSFCSSHATQIKSALGIS